MFTLKEAYHGDTIGAVSVGAIDLFHQVYSSLYLMRLKCHIRIHIVLLMEMIRNCEETFRRNGRIVERKHEEIAAIIVEPLMQGAGGMITMPKDI